MAFRLRTSQLFLTYPRCEIAPAEMLEALRSKLPKDAITDYIVAREEHKEEDGGAAHHLHVYLKTKNPVDIREPSFLDVGEAHGNYQGCRSNRAVMKYVTKDGEYITNIDLEAVEEARQTKKAIGKRLMTGTSLSAMTQEDPSLIFGYKRLKVDLLEFRLDTYQKKLRTVKAFWLWGPTGTGKSHRALAMMGETYYMKAGHNKWWDGYEGQKNVWIDELPLEAAVWNMNYMKRWSDKYPCMVEVKNSTAYLEVELLVVTAQHSIRQFYGRSFPGEPEKASMNERDIEALERRFE